MKRLLSTILAGICCIALSLSIGCSRSSYSVPPAPAAAVTQGSWQTNPPVFVVDNVTVEDLKKTNVSPNDIQSITVLKPNRDNDLVSQFGPKAKNGVILIVTKTGSK